MNKDIVKGKMQEIKGSFKEKWGKLTDNDLSENEGKSEKLLGLLRKKYGYIRGKSELEYKDSVELVKIVCRIREIRVKNKEIMTIAFVARYGQPLLVNKHENQTTENKKKYGYDIDGYYDCPVRRRTARLAL